MAERLKILGERLRKARESFNLSQIEVAEKLHIGRPRYSDIENGKRDISLEELYRFSKFLGRPLEFFVKEDLVVGEGFKVLFRKAAGCKGVSKVAVEFENLCEKMYALERLTDFDHKPFEARDYRFDNRQWWYYSKIFADREREALGLGNAPIRDLDQLLEEKCNLKIFYLPIPEEQKIFGIFAYDEKMGGCILINSNNNISKRRFSLAHEFAHYLFHKNKIALISSETAEDAIEEKIADCFASNFLMPEIVVGEIFHLRCKKRNNATPEDVLYFANYFGVSFPAMLYRLNNLKLIDNPTKEKLLEEKSATSFLESIGIKESQNVRSKFPNLYLYLCGKAFEQGKITTAKLADFLEIPLFKAMDIAGQTRAGKPE